MFINILILPKILDILTNPTKNKKSPIPNTNPTPNQPPTPKNQPQPIQQTNQNQTNPKKHKPKNNLTF